MPFNELLDQREKSSPSVSSKVPDLSQTEDADTPEVKGGPQGFFPVWHVGCYCFVYRKWTEVGNVVRMSQSNIPDLFSFMF